MKRDKHNLPGIVYTWADMVNAIITPAGGDMFTVDTPESLDTMTAAALVDLARADMKGIYQRPPEQGAAHGKPKGGKE